jgi:sulfite exporter TauE/SafE
MTIPDLALAYGLGLAGSLHCVQMCGPILLSCNMPRPHETRSSLAASHFFYHAGRLLTYSFLGALAGGLGLGIERVARYQSAAAVVAGSLMLVAGLLMIGALRRPELVQFAPAQSLIRRVAHLLQQPARAARLRMGLYMGFLPCGLIYAALLKAVSMGSAADGAITMAAFGIGTAGPLLALGIFSASFVRFTKGWSAQIPAIAVTLTGIFLIARGLMPVTESQHVHHH